MPASAGSTSSSCRPSRTPAPCPPAGRGRRPAAGPSAWSSRAIEVADQPAGLAAGQLGDVRVLLLRHDRRPGGVGVVELDPAELGASPRGRSPRRAGTGAPRAAPRRTGTRPRSRGRRRRRSSWPRSRRSRARRRRAAGSSGSDEPASAPAPERAHRGAHVPVDEPLHVALAARARGPAGGGRAARAARAAGGSCRAPACRGAARPARSARSASSATPGGDLRAASRRYSRRSVATWSLRLRPARSLPPRVPTRSSRPRSRAVCTSSSSTVGRN